MPQGEGTYGNKVGRPPSKNENEVGDGGWRTFKKQIRQEAKEKFKGGQIIKKFKFKKKRKEQFKKDYETGSWE